MKTAGSRWHNLALRGKLLQWLRRAFTKLARGPRFAPQHRPNHAHPVKKPPVQITKRNITFTCQILTNQRFVSLNNTTEPRSVVSPFKTSTTRTGLNGGRLTQHPNGAPWAASVEVTRCPCSPNRAKPPGLATLHPPREESLHLLTDTESTFEFLPRTGATSSTRDGAAEAPPRRRPAAAAAVRQPPMEFHIQVRSPPGSAPLGPAPREASPMTSGTEAAARTLLSTVG